METDVDRLFSTHDPENKLVSSGLDTVMAAIDEVATASHSFKNASEALVTETSQLADKKSDALETMESNALLIARQEQTALLQAENQARKLFELGGGAENMRALAISRDQAIDDVTAAGDRLRENEMHETYNPIEWISNAIDQANNESELLEAQQRLVNSQSAIQAMAVSSTAERELLTKNAELRTEGTIAAELSSIAADYDIKAADARIAALGSNADALHRVVTARGLVFQNLAAAYNLDQDDKNFEMGKKRHDLQVEIFMKRSAALDEDAAMKKVKFDTAVFNLQNARDRKPDELAVLAVQAQNAEEQWKQSERLKEDRAKIVQAAQASLHLEYEDPEQIQSGFNSTEQRKKYEDLYRIGLGVLQDSAVYEPSQAYEDRLQHNPTSLNSGHPIARLIKDAESNLEKFSATASKPLKPQQIKDGISSSVKETARAYQDKIVEGDSSNFYSVPPMVELEQIAEFTETPLYQKALKAVEAKNSAPSKVVPHIVEAIKSGTITIEEAASGGAIMYTAGQMHNAAKWNFPQWGLKNHTTYNAQIAMPAFGIGDKLEVLDLSDVTQWKQILMRKLRADDTRHEAAFPVGPQPIRVPQSPAVDTTKTSRTRFPTVGIRG